MAENLAKSDNNPNEDFYQAYNRWSDGGWGMIVTGQSTCYVHTLKCQAELFAGNVQVDINHLGNFVDPALQGDYTGPKDKHVETWKKYAESCQKHGTPTIVQVCHPGRQSLRGAGRRGLFAQTMAPSPIPLKIGNSWLDSLITSLAFPKPREMTQKDIDTVTRLFVDTARLMADSGFSGIELHAAHGYLIGEYVLGWTGIWY